MTSTHRTLSEDGSKWEPSVSMIERVARALFHDRYPNEEWADPHLGTERESYRGHARAAIEAMPSAASIFAAIEHGDDVHRQWLREALEAVFEGREVPKPRASRAEPHSSLSALEGEGK